MTNIKPSQLFSKAHLQQAVLSWLPFAVLITALCGLVYLAGQQNYRQSANDPQIEIAQDTAQAIGAAGSATGVVPTESVDIRQSLSPYIMTFDDNGQLQASSAMLDGRQPLPPAGVFSYAKGHTQDRFSWQPTNGVRSAAVLQHYGGAQPGFVLVGRSLTEVEKREDSLMIKVALAWVITLGATWAAILLTRR